MKWKFMGILWLLLLLAACSTELPTFQVDATPAQTASPLPTTTTTAEKSGLQVVVFYSPI